MNTAENRDSGLRRALDALLRMGRSRGPTRLSEPGEPCRVRTEVDESRRFAYVGTSKVHALFYRKDQDRFVILTELPGDVDRPWVVATVTSLQQNEWGWGRHMVRYDEAVVAFMARIVTVPRSA